MKDADMNDINVKLVGPPRPAADLEPVFQVLVKKNDDDPLAIVAPSLPDENAASNDAKEPAEMTDGLSCEVTTFDDAKDVIMDVDESPKEVDIPIVVEIAEEDDLDNDAVSNGVTPVTADDVKLSPQLNGDKATTVGTEEPIKVIETKALNDAPEEKKTDISIRSSEQNTSPNIESKEDVPKSIESSVNKTEIDSISDLAILEILPQAKLVVTTDEIAPEISIKIVSSDASVIEDVKEINTDLEETIPVLITKELEPEVIKHEEPIQDEATPNLKEDQEITKKLDNSIETPSILNKSQSPVNEHLISKSQSPINESLISESPSPELEIITDKVDKPIAQKDEQIEKLSVVDNADSTIAVDTEALPIHTVKSADEKLSSPTQDLPEVISDEKECFNDKDTDTEMVEAVSKKEVKKGGIKVVKPEVLGQPVNGDVTKDEKSIKRRRSDDIETESPLKKLCQEVEKTFPQHDTMISDYIQTATKNNIDEIQKHTEQLLAEIQTLRELAQKKEHEWNNILHLKKVKEEILLRLLRRKQVISFEKSPEVNGSGSDRKDPFEYLNQVKNLAIDKSDEISGLALRQPVAPSPPMNQPPLIQPPMMPTSHFNTMTGLPPPYDKVPMQGMPTMSNMPKNMYPQSIMMPGPTMQGFPRDMNINGGMPANYGMPMGRQGPTKDVKSIIADYRQRNPDVTPRRGRRMKSLLNPNMMNSQGPRQIAPKLDNLGNLGMIFNNLDMNQKAMLERLSQMQGAALPNGMSFKDVLVQFASMQQQGMMALRPDMMPGRVEQPCRMEHPSRPEPPPRPDPPRPSRRPERTPQQHHEEVQISMKSERVASSSPRLPPPPPYPEISLLPVNQETPGSNNQQNSLLHGILTKQASPSPQSCSPTLAKLLTSPELKQSSTTLPTFGQAKNCGEITITPVQPAVAPEAAPPQEKQEEIVQLDDEESPPSEGSAEEVGAGGGRLVIDEAPGAAEGAGGGGGEADTPLCQGCRRRDAQFVCAGCANQWYCSRDCQVAAWDDHSEMCSG